MFDELTQGQPLNLKYWYNGKRGFPSFYGMEFLITAKDLERLPRIPSILGYKFLTFATYSGRFLGFRLHHFLLKCFIDSNPSFRFPCRYNPLCGILNLLTGISKVPQKFSCTKYCERLQCLSLIFDSFKEKCQLSTFHFT